MCSQIGQPRPAGDRLGRNRWPLVLHGHIHGGFPRVMPHPRNPGLSRVVSYHRYRKHMDFRLL